MLLSLLCLVLQREVIIRITFYTTMDNTGNGQKWECLSFDTKQKEKIGNNFPAFTFDFIYLNYLIIWHQVAIFVWHLYPPFGWQSPKKKSPYSQNFLTILLGNISQKKKCAKFTFIFVPVPVESITSFLYIPLFFSTSKTHNLKKFSLLMLVNTRLSSLRLMINFLSSISF